MAKAGQSDPLADLFWTGNSRYPWFLCVCIVSCSFHYGVVTLSQKFFDFAPVDYSCNLPQNQSNYQYFYQESLVENTCQSDSNLDIRSANDTRNLSDDNILDQCHLFNSNTNEIEACPFGYNITYTYNDQGQITNNEQSITVEYELLCDKSKISTILTMLYFLGSLIGAPLGGWLLDNYGRKIGLWLGTAGLSIPSFIAVAVDSWQVFIICRFIQGVFSSLLIAGYYVSVMEIAHSKCRHIAGPVLGGAMITFGMSLGVLFAYYTQTLSWRVYVLVCNIPAINNFLLLYFVLDESPRFLISRGRFEEFKKFVNKVRRKNGSDLCTEAEFEAVLKEEREKFLKKSEPSDQLKKQESETITVKDLFKQTTTMTIFTLKFCLFWWLASLGFYSLLFANFKGVNKYIATLIMVYATLPFVVLQGWLMAKLGRRKTLALSFLISALSTAAVCFLTIIAEKSDSCESDSENSENDNSSLRQIIVALAVLGHMSFKNVFLVLYLYTAELYPTVLRGTAIGLCQVSNRFGGVCVGFIVALGSYYEWLPCLILAITSCLAFLFCFNLPETGNRLTLESLEEANQLYSRK